VESRVGELNLRVTVRPGARVALGTEVETFARAVLARCDELLHARAPRRVVLVRHLETHWRLRAEMLTSRSEFDAVAAELARYLDDQACAGRYPSGALGDVVSFDDEAQWRAAFVAAPAAERARAWYFAPLAARSPAGAEPAGTEHPPTMPGQAASAGAQAAGVRAAARPEPADADAFGGDLSGAARALEPPAAVAVSGVERVPGVRRDTVEVPLRTEFGGLFFLLNPILELGLGELLWTMGLPEGAVLARTAAALLGAAGDCDPGPRLLGGRDPAAELGPLADDLLEGAARSMLVALAEALPRRGLGRIPPLTVGTVVAPCGRLLVATITGTELPVLVRPATSSAAVESGLELLGHAWPREAAPVRGTRGLAALAPAWLQIDPRARVPEHALCCVTNDTGTTALVSQLAGTLGGVLAARTASIVEGEHLGWQALVSTRLAVPAVVRQAPEAITVSFDPERVDLAVRRAGLDRDPGWVPWLEAEVRFEFEEGAA